MRVRCLSQCTCLLVLASTLFYNVILVEGRRMNYYENGYIDSYQPPEPSYPLGQITNSEDHLSTHDEAFNDELSSKPYEVSSITSPSQSSIASSHMPSTTSSSQSSDLSSAESSQIFNDERGLMPPHIQALFETVNPSPISSMTPSNKPSNESSNKPSNEASSEPSNEASSKPSVTLSSLSNITQPSITITTHSESVPTIEPTVEPTVEPTIEPTMDPTLKSSSLEPTVEPTIEPTLEPTEVEPTLEPEPTSDPTQEPSVDPTQEASFVETTNVHVSYYDAIGWSMLPSGGLASYSVPPYKSEMTETINFSKTAGTFAGSGRKKSVAASFTGYLKFESVGVAWFCLKSNDGSNLYIDDLLKINNDGIHTDRRRCGTFDVLDAGDIHKITVDYFQSRTTGSTLVLTWRAPGVDIFTTVPSTLWIASLPTPMPASQELTYPPTSLMEPQVKNVLVGYYEAVGWTRLPFEGIEYSKLYPYSLEKVETINYSKTTGNFAGSGRSEDVAALFTGYLKSNSNGLAWFCIKSSDGSRLYVDNIMKVNNDGIHKSRSRCGAVKMLQDTVYKITVDFFQSKGESSLVLKWRQPGALNFSKIPSSLWVGAPPTPSPTVSYIESAAPSISSTMNVEVSYFEAEEWTSLPSNGLASYILYSYKSEIVNTINYPNTFGDFAGSGKSESVAALFIGFLEFETEGEAWFCITSNDGSKLYVDDELKVNNDGIHEDRTRCGIFDVEQKGVTHKISLEYFQSTGSSTLLLTWKQPGEYRSSRGFETIPPSAWVSSTNSKGNVPTLVSPELYNDNFPSEMPSKLCPSDPNPEQTFFTGEFKTKNGNMAPMKRNCTWLAGREPSKVYDLCSMTHGLEVQWITIPPARDVCTGTCNSC